ncbi:MAG: hypothetical protein C0606_10125 [Hyphomicrobiales bacterium]|nr:MAG: hypothetical protein C0606_10125 [Hyphomicrobiales bacterium]
MTVHPVRSLLLAAAGLVAISAAPALGADEQLGGPFASEHFRDHPLVGTIWSVGSGEKVDIDALTAAATGADVVMLGEHHDNPDHHRLQATMIDRLAEAGRKPGVVLEMVTEAERKAMNAYLASDDRSAEGFGPAVTWTERGWPDWKIYQPIAASFIGHDLPVYAGDLSKDDQRRIGKEGLEALPADFRTISGLEIPLGAEREDALLTVLEESHCGMVPKAGLRPMLGVQRGRDAQLADVVIEAVKKEGSAVLIAGNGHIRGDWAVPWYLAERAPELKVVRVAFVEADPEETAFTDYLPQSASGKPVYDYVWITPRAVIKDHCAELRAHFEKRMKKMKEKKAAE